jgi:hypothetical protein
MIYDIWYMIYDIRHMIYNLLHMLCRGDIYDLVELEWEVLPLHGVDRDVSCVVGDCLSCKFYDIWHMIYDIWYIIYDLWYIIYYICYAEEIYTI